MSTFEPSLNEIAAAVAEPRAAFWPRCEAWLERRGEQLNPILVKECRQALKSRQFTITFALLLICGWVWSLWGVALLGPEIAYSFKSGPTMFAGYFAILAFPLLVIVPFGAYRSLAVEREDRTFELLSITTQTPRQIVSGKLGSAVVQMMVYFSALSPCLAFTYLLRGIDLLSIGYLLVCLFVASLSLSMVALLLATLSDKRHWQSLMSVAMVVSLFIVFYGATAFVIDVYLREPVPFREEGFLIFNAILVTVVASYFVLFFLAACARLTFASGNRSTRLRVAMLVQYLLFAGWMGYGWFHDTGSRHVPWEVTFLAFSGLHWFAMGALMTGESGRLSARVRRGLPQSDLGRLFFAWSNPGPGAGYVYALSGLAAAGLLAYLAAALRLQFGGGVSTIRFFNGSNRGLEFIIDVALVVFDFVAIYLGLGNLLLNLLRRAGRDGILMAVMVNLILVLFGTLAPQIVHGLSGRYDDGYSLLDISNPFRTFAEVAQDQLAIVAPEVVYLLAAGALLVIALNLPAIARELQQTRLAKPMRVAEEDAQVAAIHAPAPQPTSPWDEGAE